MKIYLQAQMTFSFHKGYLGIWKLMFWHTVRIKHSNDHLQSSEELLSAQSVTPHLSLQWLDDLFTFPGLQ